MKELLQDKDRLKIDVRIVYGKSELLPAEMEWLRSLTFVRTSFCKNLHAKCYINEELCIITSMNLYEFSQVNNNEMGILIRRSTDHELYRDAYEEAQRIIRISDEVRISVESVASEVTEPSTTAQSSSNEKVSSSKLGRILGVKTAAEVLDLAVNAGLIELVEGGHVVTDAGLQAGVEFVEKSRFGAYFLWPTDIKFDTVGS